MTQVTSKTSQRLHKVHLRTYIRSLGGLVVKWECAERVKVTLNNLKKKLHHFLEAITLFKVVQFSIFLLFLMIGDQIYQNQLKYWKLDHSERHESQNKKGALRIRGPRDEKLKLLIFPWISLKHVPLHFSIIRNWYQTNFGCFSWFQDTYSKVWYSSTGGNFFLNE